jgi:hypothetical protein
MKYDKVSEVMFEDLNDWLIGKYSNEIKLMYTYFIEEYLSENFGKLNDKTHKEMVRHLLARLIS